MPGLADLLRAGRVAGAVLRLVGRHRVASVVAVVLALGWFLYGLGFGDSDSFARAVSATGSLGLIVTGPYSVPDGYGDGHGDGDAHPVAPTERRPLGAGAHNRG